MNEGVRLVNYRLTPIQAAFFEYLKDNPYITFHELACNESSPLQAAVPDEFGMKTVRFDKLVERYKDRIFKEA